MGRSAKDCCEVLRFSPPKTTHRVPLCGTLSRSIGPARNRFPRRDWIPRVPLVYVCMGTLQNGVERVFRIVAETCASLPIQTVISLGGGLPAGALGALLGDPIVVRYAPQLELLRKAALTVFHGGLNTALESLSCGVPMVAIPVTMHQPGVAARIMWTNTGRTIPVTQLTIERLRLEIKELLTKPGYRAQAQHLQ
jgi:zeaxanthin glucosyltransferase